MEREGDQWKDGEGGQEMERGLQRNGEMDEV